jgi:AraC-like DNA-binding protein
MRENVAARPSVQELARRAGLGPAHFSALFLDRFGQSPIAHLIQIKMRHACLLLDSSDWSVARIASEVGYDDPFYFSRLFSRTMGCSPRNYRDRPKG